MSQPQIVLFPGAWHLPTCYSLIIPKLEAAGYTVHTTQLPSVTDKDPPKDLSADIAVARAIVDKAIGSGNDVIVVCHSWSGIVVGSALVGYSKKEREEKGKEGGVVRCGYMCAFLAPEGLSLTESIQGPPPTWWTIEGEHFARLTDSAGDILYNDLPDSHRAQWFEKVSRTHSVHSFVAKATGESWKQIPTYYLICEDDLAIPVAGQEAMTAMVKNMGGELRTERLKSSHSPFLSHVDETVSWIRGVAGEDA
ncbi:alpha/beta-hydrolase [Paraphaeosphaeria sporulosa]|uniref:Alpha/beta-hydrolase n=1 Tax=Paraphaeosphaeria sporulosa TaxID=1460663 RepID=A0A177C356_9PLEO|nr:alpha/beta-hydrolase [Paraphaeosphaeria sporulosa]OAG01601.1 alpha/beta-hydrolase [Paraphaeosphaeria sporulosa]